MSSVFITDNKLWNILVLHELHTQKSLIYDSVNLEGVSLLFQLISIPADNKAIKNIATATVVTLPVPMTYVQI